MLAWLFVLSYHFVVFGSVKDDVYKKLQCNTMFHLWVMVDESCVVHSANLDPLGWKIKSCDIFEG